MKVNMYSAFEFHPSETRIGEDGADNDDQHILELNFQQERWTEHHPYGNTTAGQDMFDNLDTGRTLYLDREPVTRVELDSRFGCEWVKDTLRWMEDNARGPED